MCLFLVCFFHLSYRVSKLKTTSNPTGADEKNLKTAQAGWQGKPGTSNRGSLANLRMKTSIPMEPGAPVCPWYMIGLLHGKVRFLHRFSGLVSGKSINNGIILTLGDLKVIIF